MNEFIVDFEVNQNPYNMFKKNTNSIQRNLSNYSFGGVSPMKIMKSSQSLAQVNNQRPKSAVVTD
jgi:hypothetical protein